MHYLPSVAANELAMGPLEPDDDDTGLQPIEFSTDEVPAPDRFSAWREVHATAFDLRPLGDDHDFSARHKTWDLGQMVFQTVQSDALHFAGLAELPRREPLDHWIISLCTKGQTTTEAGPVRLENVGAVPQLTSLMQPFHGQISRSRLQLLYIPRDTCRDASHLLDAGALTLLQSGLGGIFADYMRSLESRMAQLQQADLADLVDATRALLLAALAPSPDRLDHADTMINHVLIERAKQYVQVNLQNPALDVQAVVRGLCVSRSRLYRLFEPSGGIMHYIQKRRLLAAHKVLTDPSESRRIFEVADIFCFNDAAEFSRAFRREFGYSPSDARADGRSAAGDRAFHGPYQQDLGSLLRRVRA
jgi:AraC-like DNA-binding protein